MKEKLRHYLSRALLGAAYVGIGLVYLALLYGVASLVLR